jgi:16S rRNA processing protein RimM
MYQVGIIVKPQGVKGEVKVKISSPRPERFYDLDKVYIRFDKLKTCSIENIRISNGFVFLKLANIDTRNDAELLRNKEIMVSEDQLIDLGENEYFVHDLIGCRVISEEGLTIGEIEDIIQNSSNDIYIVKDRQGQEILIPAINDVVKDVDINARQVTIHVLEGLLG